MQARGIASARDALPSEETSYVLCNDADADNVRLARGWAKTAWCQALPFALTPA